MRAPYWRVRLYQSYLRAVPEKCHIRRQRLVLICEPGAGAGQAKPGTHSRTHSLTQPCCWGSLSGPRHVLSVLASPAHSSQVLHGRLQVAVHPSPSCNGLLVWLGFWLWLWLWLWFWLRWLASSWAPRDAPKSRAAVRVRASETSTRGTYSYLGMEWASKGAGAGRAHPRHGRRLIPASITRAVRSTATWYLYPHDLFPHAVPGLSQMSCLCHCHGLPCQAVGPGQPSPGAGSG